MSDPNLTPSQLALLQRFAASDDTGGLKIEDLSNQEREDLFELERLGLVAGPEGPANA